VGGIQIASGYTGTITQGAGNAVTVTSTVGYSQAAGTFAGSAANVTVNGVFSLTGGTFTSTAGVLSIGGNSTFSNTFLNNSGTVQFAATSTITGSSTFNNLKLGNNNNITLTIATGTVLTVQSSTTFVTNYSSVSLLGGGEIDTQGNLSASYHGGVATGTAAMVLDGTGNQTVDGTFLLYLPNLTITKTSGSVSLVGSNPISILGSFTNTNGTTINPGTSTVSFFGPALTIIGSSTFYNLMLGYGSAIGGGGGPGVNISDNAITVATNTVLTAQGYLWFNTNNSVVRLLGGGTINAQGNIEGGYAPFAATGTAAIVLNGTSTQIVNDNSVSGQSSLYLPNLTISKSSGIALATSSPVDTGYLIVTNGEFRLGSTTVASTFEVDGTSTISASGTLSDYAPLTATSTLKLGGNLVNNGTLTLSGGGASCGNIPSVYIRSTTTGVQRTWSGTGTSTLQNVDMEDQTSTVAINVYNSTNSGNNGPNFSFVPCPGVPALTQTSYRFYANATSTINPVTALAAEGTASTITSTSTPIRLLMNLTDANAALATTTTSFKLQFSTATSSGWADVGTSGSTSTWTFYNNTSLTDGAAIISTLLASSTVGETYDQSNPTASNTAAIAVGKVGEWDFALIPANATSNTPYYFRIVNASGTVPLYAYTSYPSVTAFISHTYYISSSNGSDTYDGLEKVHTTGNTGPWQHAPGMNAATGTPVAYAPSSEPGDTFIFKGCDVWTNESFSWIIGVNSGWSSHGYYTNATTPTAGLNFLGDSDKTWYNATNCPVGWNRPVLDACKISAPPSGNLPGCTGSNVAEIGGNATGTFIEFVPNYVTISGFEFRNHYHGRGTLAGWDAVFIAPQYTSYGDIKDNYYHAWIALTPVFTTGTVASGSNVMTITSTTANIVVGEPISIECTYCVFPPANNGPIVSAVSGTQVTVTNGAGSPVYASNNNCQISPCTVVGGFDSGAFTPIQGYSNGTGMTFEQNVIDGWDTALVQADPNCTLSSVSESSTYGNCLGTVTAFYQGPAIVKNNVVRYVASYYLGGIQNFSGNLFTNERVSINPTAHSNGEESLGDSGLGLVAHDNVFLGIHPGVPFMVAPEPQFITSGSISSGGTTLTVASTTGFVFGGFVRVTGAGQGGSDLIAVETNLTGNTITIDTAASVTVSGATVTMGGIYPSYVWNNVFSDMTTNGPIELANTGYLTAGTVYVWNNTVESGPDPNGTSKPSRYPVYPMSGCPSYYQNCDFENNHAISCAGSPGSPDCNNTQPLLSPCGSNCTQSGNVSESWNDALSKGMTISETYNFSPSSGLSPTIGAANNLSSKCSIILTGPNYSESLASLCSDTVYAVSYDATNHVAVIPARTSNTRPTLAAWDAGAYQYVATYTLTTSTSPSSGGSISLSPSGGTYASGTQVTLTATPASGYAFSSWSGGVSTTTNPLTITLTSNVSLTANFSVVTTSSGSSSSGVTVQVGAGGVYATATPTTSTTTASSASSTLPATASTATLSLQAEIDLLTRELQVLLAEAKQQGIASSLPVGIPTSLAVPAHDLQLWNKGADVQSLQKILVQEDAGPWASRLKTNGTTRIFGLLTYRALREFQASYTLPVTGYFGPLTRAKMKMLLGE
jgi:hypothetical protein